MDEGSQALPDLPDAFLRANDAGRREQDRRDGQRVFWRLEDEDRVTLIINLMTHLEVGRTLNTAATGGAFREAWDGEPYLNGLRWGSYFSAVDARAADRFVWGIAELVWTWGGAMMTAEERRRFSELEFPITAYRGGVGEPGCIAGGLSWTTDIEIAAFYALDWPARWGIEGEPHILSAQVHIEDVVAAFDERQESELVVVGGLPKDRVCEIPITYDDGPAPLDGG